METHAIPSFIMSEKRWVFPDGQQPEVSVDLKSIEKLPESLARLLQRRGISTRTEMEEFFRPSVHRLHDPFLMKDLEKAVNRLISAIQSGEKIMVFGDYDVDGTTATALVFRVLSSLQAKAVFYIPDRYREGYGISIAGIESAAEQGVSLIVALDCGIKAHDKVQYAKERSIDFIICDHHLPGDTLPEAFAVLDPKRSDCRYPYKELSGCGVGFKLMQGLLEKSGNDSEMLMECLDLVALSIASDIVPVSGENRILLHAGLDKINRNPSTGMAALLEVAGFQMKESGSYGLRVDRLVFGLGPRINAAGRIGHGKGAVDLLLAEDPVKALEFARSVDIQNNERRELDKSISQEAIDLIESSEEYLAAFSTVLYRESWHKGVIGIVASRCIEKYHRPTIILTLSDGKLVGSGRSVPGFDLYAALDACSEHLIQFGGHFFAAGLSLHEHKLPDFRNAFEAEVRKKMRLEDLQPVLTVDACLEPAEINRMFFRWVEGMGPFGPGNMNPLFVLKNMKDGGQSRLLENKSGGSAHIKFSLSHPGLSFEGSTYTLDGIGFGMGEFWPMVQSGQPFDLAFHLEENVFRDRSTIQLMVKEIRPSAGN
jgi:single-stranded-DNA-specific exonuclease